MMPGIAHTQFIVTVYFNEISAVQNPIDFSRFVIVEKLNYNNNLSSIIGISPGRYFIYDGMIMISVHMIYLKSLYYNCNELKNINTIQLISVAQLTFSNIYFVMIQ